MNNDTDIVPVNHKQATSDLELAALNTATTRGTATVQSIVIVIVPALQVLRNSNNKQDVSPSNGNTQQ